MNNLPDELVQELETIGEDINAVLDDAVDNSATADIFTKQLSSNLTFFGKSLQLWEDEMVVPIPNGRLDVDVVRDLYVELANKLQKANHFFCLANAASTVSNTGVNIKRADLTSALIAHYHASGDKIPPSTVIDRMVDGYLRKLNNMAITGKIIRDFWKEKLNTLDRVKSCLSSIAINYATEMKYGGGDD